jgi:hypothetical protein
MKKLVIMPGGFHPWHAGHTALYQAAKSAFPSADVFVAATADTTTRPFPFKIKKLLAQAAGVPANRFIQVKSPFRAEEITQMYDPAETQLIFVRSEKDQDQSPKPGGVKKSGEPSYLQQYRRAGLMPMTQHAYMHYLPVAQFGPGMTSATEIRSKWPDMNDQQRSQLVKTIYPAASSNDAAVAKLVEILDSVMSTVSEMIETVETSSDSTDSVTGSTELNQLIRQLSAIAALISQRDFAAVKQALTSPELINLLTSLEQPTQLPDSEIDNDQSADYADEK